MNDTYNPTQLVSSINLIKDVEENCGKNCKFFKCSRIFRTMECSGNEANCSTVIYSTKCGCCSGRSDGYFVVITYFTYFVNDWRMMYYIVGCLLVVVCSHILQYTLIIIVIDVSKMTPCFWRSALVQCIAAMLLQSKVLPPQVDNNTKVPLSHQHYIKAFLALKSSTENRIE